LLSNCNISIAESALTRDRFHQHCFPTFSLEQDEKLFWQMVYGEWCKIIAKFSSYLAKFRSYLAKLSSYLAKLSSFGVGETEWRFFRRALRAAVFLVGAQSLVKSTPDDNQKKVKITIITCKDEFSA